MIFISNSQAFVQSTALPASFKLKFFSFKIPSRNCAGGATGPRCSRQQPPRCGRHLAEDKTTKDRQAPGPFLPSKRRTIRKAALTSRSRPGGNPGANPKSISHRCYLWEVAFKWRLNKETIDLPLGCLKGGWRCLARGQPRVRSLMEILTRDFR